MHQSLLRLMRLVLVVVLGMSMGREACGGENAERLAQRNVLISLSDEIFAQMVASPHASEGSRAALRDVGLQLERTACAEESPLLQLIGLRCAAMTFLRSASPNLTTPSDAQVRRHPGAAWSDYLRVSRDLLWRYRGIDDARAAAIAMPDGFFFGGEEGPGFTYGDEYWQLGLTLFRESSHETVRILAASNVVSRCALADWQLACEISGAAYELEERAAPDNIADVRRIYEAVDSMHRTMSQELNLVGRGLNKALALRVSNEGGESDLQELRDGERLWEVLRPYLPAVIEADGGGRQRIPSWMDLQTNRLTSVPGLRLVAILSTEGDNDGQGLALHFEQEFWVEAPPGALTPWAERMYERAKTIDSATVAGNPWFGGQ